MNEIAFDRHLKYTKFYMTDANKLEYIKVISAGIIKAIQQADNKFIVDALVAINKMTSEDDNYILKHIDPFVTILRKARELIG